MAFGVVQRYQTKQIVRQAQVLVRRTSVVMVQLVLIIYGMTPLMALKYQQVVTRYGTLKICKMASRQAT